MIERETRFLLRPVNKDRTFLVDHGFMEKFGYYPDTDIYTGFYVKKIGSKQRKSSIFIDLYGVYTVPGGILWNVNWPSKTCLEFEDAELEFLLEDLIAEEVIEVLDTPIGRFKNWELGTPLYYSHLFKD